MIAVRTLLQTIQLDCSTALAGHATVAGLHAPAVWLKHALHAGCEYAAVERVNREHVAPILADLVKQPFFRYFKVRMGAWSTAHATGAERRAGFASAAHCRASAVHSSMQGPGAAA